MSKSDFRGFGIDETCIFAEMYTLIDLCSLGQVKHGSLHESTRSSLVVSVFTGGQELFFFVLFLVSNV